MKASCSFPSNAFSGEDMPVLDRMLTTMSRYSMLRAGDRVIAAVSGGADSVCLFLCLKELAPLLGARVAGIAHLNHKLRGADSDGDEQFVEELAARHGVAFYREEARVADAGGNLEQEARKARLNLYERLIREGECDYVATGHTRDDQAETVLFRILRGSGTAGMAGILPVTRQRIIRPLIETSRAEVEKFLRARGVEWREDASNRDIRFARNRIRHELLPALEHDWNPAIRETLARMADVAGEEERWWRGKIAKIAGKLAIAADGGIEIRTDAVAGLPKPFARRLVRELMRAAGGRAAELEHVDRAIALASSTRGSGCVTTPGLAVTRSFGWLRFSAASVADPEPVRVEVPGRYDWMNATVCFAVSPAGLEGKSGESGCARLKWRGLHGVLELRGWKEGDHYRPLGQQRDRKLKEMFQKARVPSWKRSFWPIVTDGCKILWAREFGVAAELASGSESGSSLYIWEEKQPGHESFHPRSAS